MFNRIKKILAQKQKFNDEQIKTFTKVWVGRILYAGLIFIAWSYILASIGKTEIAENLSMTVCKIMIGTFVPYLAKSFFETFCESRIDLLKNGLVKPIKDEKDEVTEEIVDTDTVLEDNDEEVKG